MYKIVKISESAAPDFKSAEWTGFIAGAENPGVSLPIEYEIKGTFECPPKVGGLMNVMRTERNGVPILGVFTSSPIVEISAYGKTGKVIETANSVYLVEKIDK